jgi:hypothetical protein
MQPSDRTKIRAGDLSRRAGKRRSAEIVWLEEWRVRRQQQTSRWRRAPRPMPMPMPMPQLPRRYHNAAPRGHAVPIEAWLMALILVSAVAGAVFALMGTGYLP